MRLTRLFLSICIAFTLLTQPVAGSASYTTAQIAPFLDSNPATLPTRLVIRTKNRGPFGLLGKPGQAALLEQMSAIPAAHATHIRTWGDYQVYDLGISLDPAEYQQVAQALAQVSGVTSIEQDVFVFPDETIPNDPWMADNPFTSRYQYSIKKDGYFFGMAQHPYWGINALDAWDITSGDPNLRVAVLDTGSITHPDLTGRWLGGYDFISSNTYSGDGDGWDADPTDTSHLASISGSGTWHGAHVAGTIGASANNAYGIAGLNWNSPIVPVRVLGWGGGWFSDTVAGLVWAAGLPVPGVPANPYPAKVMNLSLGGQSSTCPSYIQAAIDQVYNAGSVVVVAAGNSHFDVQNQTPANCEHVISVGAAILSLSPDLASFSNYGNRVTISAPGVEVYSTTYTSKTDLTPAITSKQGTSMASPHVAGVVSLMLSIQPDLTFEQVTVILKDTARAFPAGSWCAANPGMCGAGLIDAHRAVRSAAEFIFPTATFTSTPLPSFTPTASATPTFTPSPTATSTPTATPMPPTPTAIPVNVFPSIVDGASETELTISGTNFTDVNDLTARIVSSNGKRVIARLEVSRVNASEIRIHIPANRLAGGNYRIILEGNLSGSPWMSAANQVLSVHGGNADIYLPCIVR